MQRLLLILLLIASYVQCAYAGNEPGPGYRMENEPSGEPYDWTVTGAPEKPWKHAYHKIIVTKLALCDRKPDGSVGHIRFTFAQTLEVIRKLHNIIPDLPKVIYIVGWQFNGHDSKYPSWAQVNEHLKRPEDEDAVTSLRWLMREARIRYNTYVSLHINMLDAYEDSPLWDTYVKYDIIAKHKDGSIRWSQEWGGMRAACISYYREWELGFAQKRIDDLVAMLPELKDAATIHIDAFQVYDGNNRSVSEVLDHTLDDEVRTMRKIYRYWRDRYGIDVTAETFVQKRVYVKTIKGERQTVRESFAGLQPWCWLFTIGKGEKTQYLNEFYPPQIYSKTLLPLAPCFNRVKEGCGDVPESWTWVKRMFFTWTIPHYLRHTAMERGEPVDKEVSWDEMRRREICLPIGWRNDNSVGIYLPNRPTQMINGVRHKTWKLPDSWKGVKKASVVAFNPEGWEPRADVAVDDCVITIPMEQDDGFILKPKN
ncbi:MAG TPA: endo-alpha-N-acetylgalactosaminidase family protein [Sedimentisphaerales bacterium]|nr:endo-alpha-N-acetylgalactosaminidase family protein [Sedimentisphaerales bacterium]